jgi:hypothetical protein
MLWILFGNLRQREFAHLEFHWCCFTSFPLEVKGSNVGGRRIRYGNKSLGGAWSSRWLLRGRSTGFYLSRRL